jgi:hypothetical protein
MPVDMKPTQRRRFRSSRLAIDIARSVVAVRSDFGEELQHLIAVHRSKEPGVTAE